jgi:NitT/TauT family transport system substrate-binding protein
MFNEKSLGAMALLIVIGLAACAPSTPATPPLTPVTVQLRWTHNAQFAGFYAAEQKGYYAAEGLAVTFVEGGANVDFIRPVLDGKAQFGIANADGLVLARAENKPTRAIATIYRRSPSVFLALAESGIQKPQDFVGKRIRVVPVSAPIFHTMMARVGIAPSQYTEVNVAANLTPLYSGEIDVSVGFVTNEVLTAQAAGYKLNLIYPDDYGVHFYADTLFTTEDLIAKNPDLVRRFLRATLQGWTYAVENPTTIGALVQKYNPDADAALENAKMTASLPLVNTGEDHIGWMKPAVWSGMEKTLREQGVLTKTVTMTDVYTMQFLNEIYPSR